MGIRQKLSILFSISLGACAVDVGDGPSSVGSEELAAESLGESDAALCRNALSPAQEKTALKLIDDICGDTWCEGDHDFAFEHLTCRSGSPRSPGNGVCTLKLRIISRDDATRSYPRTCTTRGFAGFGSLVETASSGYQSLNWDYYLSLSDCINELEAELPG